MRPTLTRKYLEGYGTWKAFPGLKKSWSTAVVVPCFEEREFVPDLLYSLERAANKNPKVLAIFVVNAKENSPLATFEDNSALLDLLKVDASPILDCPPTFFAEGKALDRLIIDRSSPPYSLGKKEGVGLARKIGCDLAVHYWGEGFFAQDFFSTTDGDARVSETYFQDVFEPPLTGLGDEVVASLSDFHHDTSIPSLAIYDQYLRDYVKGLEFAGSPYAYPSLGSLIHVRFDAYVKVRGFKNLLAAEDFYFLEKLAQFGKIARHPSRVDLVGRRSMRVPFGTGAAMEKIENGERAGFLIAPEVFQKLKTLIEMIRTEDPLLPISKWEENTMKQIGLKGTNLLRELGFFESVSTAQKTRTRRSDFSRAILSGRCFGGLGTFQMVRNRYFQGK